MKNKQFPITTTPEERAVIKEGARLSRRSVSNFLIWSGLEQVKNLKSLSESFSLERKMRKFQEETPQPEIDLGDDFKLNGGDLA